MLNYQVGRETAGTQRVLTLVDSTKGMPSPPSHSTPHFRPPLAVQEGEKFGVQEVWPTEYVWQGCGCCHCWSISLSNSSPAPPGTGAGTRYTRMHTYTHVHTHTCIHIPRNQL